MVLQASEQESAVVFGTEDDSDAVLLDLKGVYCLLDGGPAPIPLLRAFRQPTAVVLSQASKTTLPNAVALNQPDGSLVAVVGNVPSAAAVKDGAQGEVIRELHKALAVPPTQAVLHGAKPEPIVLYKDLSHGTLTLYVLAGDAKDTESLVKAYHSGDAAAIENAASNGSSVYLLVWHPARDDQPIKRILHTGTAPLARIQQALEKARTLPVVHQVITSGASLKAPPPKAAPSSARASAAKAPAPSSARPAPPARAAPAAKPPAARAAPPARPPAPKPAAAAAPKPSARTSMASRPAPAVKSGPTATPRAAPAAKAPVPSRTSTASKPAPAPSKAPARPAKEEVAKKTTVTKTEGARLSRAAPAPKATPAPTANGKKPVAAAAAAGVAVATGAAAAIAAASSTEQPGSVVKHPAEDALIQQEPEPMPAVPSVYPTIPSPTSPEPSAPPAELSTPTVDGSGAGGFSINADDLLGGGHHDAAPALLPVPPSPTVIPATPQPPHSDDEEFNHTAVSPEPPAPHQDIEEPIPEPVREPSPIPSPVKEPSPIPSPEPSPVEPSPYVPPEPEHGDVPSFIEDPIPHPVVEPHPEPTPVEPTQPEPHTGGGGEPALGDLIEPAAGGGVQPSLGDLIDAFTQPFVPQQPGHDGLLDALEDPPRLMKISMDTEQLEAALGLSGGDVNQNADKTEDVVQAAEELDDLLTPSNEEEYQRKLSQQAEENLLSTAAVPFIAGLASTVVEAATIDGAKQNVLESLLTKKQRSVDSPTGEMLHSFRSTGYENADEPKEIKYEEADPALDGILTELADESDAVNKGKINGGDHVDGNGWPENVTMHLPPRQNGVPAKQFKLAGPVHVELCSVPHRGSNLLLPDAATALEFFMYVRSTTYILPSGGEVPEYVLDGWLKGKAAWAANVPSKIIATRHNPAILTWASKHAEDLSDANLTVVTTAIENSVMNIPSDDQMSAKAMTIIL